MRSPRRGRGNGKPERWRCTRSTTKMCSPARARSAANSSRPPELTHVLIATGGGGADRRRRGVVRGVHKVISVEPEGCPTLFSALKAGRPVEVPSPVSPPTRSAPVRSGELMFPVVRRSGGRRVGHRRGDSSRATMVVGRIRLIAEPGGATALAALLAGRIDPPNARGSASSYAAATRIREGRVAVTQDVVLLEVDARGVATVTLNRPEVGNAYNAAMLDGADRRPGRLAGDKAVRCLVIRGAGKHFQAGADIRWLNEVGHYPPAENFDASLATTRAMKLLNEFPKPTIALVHGACFGGGVGWSAASMWRSRRRTRSSASPRCASASRPRRFPPTWSTRSGCVTRAGMH